MSAPWPLIARLCLVNAAIGGLAALPINLFNRLMTVELGWAAGLPGLLVALHYGVQISRPVWGHRSDASGARTPLILGGMAVLGAGLLLAAWAMALPPGAALAGWVAAYVLIGLGVGAAGTSFLAMLATASGGAKRGPAATLAWLMLIAGAIAASVGAGATLDPFSQERLMAVVAVLVAAALALTLAATWRVEERLPATAPQPEPAPLGVALRATLADPAARRFTGFVLLSIFAFYLSELVLEPFAGHVHGLTPGESTTLSGGKDGAALAGMIAAGALAMRGAGSLRLWAVVGCVVSAAGLLALGAGLPLLPATVALGFGNGLFVVGAIGSMMRLAADVPGRTGTRMGVFGAAQAVAAGTAGLVSTHGVDLAGLAMPLPAAYGTVFTFEALVFLSAALVASRVLAPRPLTVPGE